MHTINPQNNNKDTSSKQLTINLIFGRIARKCTSRSPVFDSSPTNPYFHKQTRKTDCVGNTSTETVSIRWCRLCTRNRYITCSGQPRHRIQEFSSFLHTRRPWTPIRWDTCQVSGTRCRIALRPHAIPWFVCYCCPFCL